ncbi:MAG: DUF4234 domain-containing protein [Victivallaceae bacterium]|nr:DUF4234 domain-containing protein [Victivallaceae bacterium]
MVMHRPVAMVLIFTVITCGLYWLFWAYTTRCEIKQYLGDQSINPGLDVLLMIICFPYCYYWFYKYSKEIAAAEEKAGIAATDNSLVNLFLAVFGLSLIAMLIMQSQLNAVAAKQ